MKLNNRRAIITGGAGGIGKEIALTFAREGCNVAIIDLLDSGKIIREVQSLGRKCLGFKVGVDNSAEVNRTIQKVLDEFEGIDILVNAAAIARRSNIVEMTDEEWNKVISVNLTGTFYCTRAVLPAMMKQRWGRIISFSSVAGAWGAWPNASHYTASKAGVIGFNLTLAGEVAPYNITANVIAPGIIDTPMSRSKYGSLGSEEGVKATLNSVPMRRIGQPKDIANTVLFLASEEASYITGQVIHVNGGLTLGLTPG